MVCIVLMRISSGKAMASACLSRMRFFRAVVAIVIVCLIGLWNPMLADMAAAENALSSSLTPTATQMLDSEGHPRSTPDRMLKGASPKGAGLPPAPPAGSFSEPSPGSPPDHPPGSLSDPLSGSTPEEDLASIIWSHYRMGDSPVHADGLFEWTKPKAMKQWRNMPPSGQAVGEAEYVWLVGRTTPQGASGSLVADAHLLFKNAGYAFELYSGQERIFHYADLSGEKDRLLPAKPILVSLEKHASDRPLFLRIYSKNDSVMLGKVGPVQYGSRTNLELGLIREDSRGAIGMLIFFVIGIVSTLMYFINRENNKASLYLGLFALTICTSLMLSLRSLSLFLDLSIAALYVQEPLSCVSAYLFTLYFIQVLKPVLESLVRWTGRALLVIGAIIPLAKAIAPGIFQAYGGGIAIIWDIGFSILCALCLLVIGLSYRVSAGSDAKWFVIGFSIYLIVNLIGHPLRLIIESNRSLFAFNPLEFIYALNLILDFSLIFSTIFLGIITFKRYAEVHRAIRDYNLQLSNWNQSLELKVGERTKAIQNLLDYAGQGFLTIDCNLMIQEEYSIECRRLFKRDIASLKYTELLYPYHAAEQALHEEILIAVFQADEPMREVCLSLLASEGGILGKRISLQYKWIPGHPASGDKVMVILTDVSQQRKLESQMAKERKVLSMVVWVMKHYHDFKEMVAEYRKFAQVGMKELLNADLTAEDKWAQLSRAVHTFKGSFAQIDFIHTTEGLHDLESQLSEWKLHSSPDKSHASVDEVLEEWLANFDLLGWLEEDISVLRDVLGDRFDIGRAFISVELDRLRHLEQLVYKMLPSKEAQRIIAELKKLQYRPFHDLFSMYPEYTRKLAEQSGKELYPVHIVGGDLLVNPDIYMEFVRSLIHIFRNMVDHGIETPEARASVGKDRRGSITCEIVDRKQEIEIKMSNDGSEMDVHAIRARALSMGFCTKEELGMMSAEESRLLIFHEGFTTKSKISELSGRGIGLSAVYKALMNLNGTVRIELDDKHGTIFVFTLPWMD
jgi:HPt (histidine-containing phosphotransfer) domain-containing protein